MLDYLVGGLIGANITIVVLYAVGWWPTRSRLIVLDNYANYHTIALDAISANLAALGKRGKR